MTIGADTLALHHAEYALVGLNDYATTATASASFHFSVLAAAAVAMVTYDIILNLKLLGCSVDNLLQGKFNAQTLVTAFVHRFLPTSATSAKTAKSTEAHAFEYIAESRENVVYVGKSTASADTADSVETELVVSLTFLRVVEHFVGFGSLLELLLCFFVTRIAVRVILDGHLLIGPFYLVFAGILLDAQHFVIVAFCHFLLTEN